MKRILTCALVFLAIVSVAAHVPHAFGQDYVNFLSNLDAGKALSIVTDLEADSYEGRKAGTNGADLASEYIANYFKSLGLKPARDFGVYRTEFVMPLWKLTQMPSLTMVDDSARQSFLYRKDFYVQACSGSGDFSADVVFAGYGITAPSIGYDDYAGLAANGKVVIAVIGTPPSEQIQKGDYGSWLSKANSALNHGASGLILVDSPANPTPHYVERWSGGWRVLDKLVMLRGSIDMVNTLLGAGKTLASLQESIDRNLKPASFVTGAKLQVSVAISFNENAKAYNVLGFIPGYDPAASQKVVIIGSHYDHLGKDIDGSIFRGANDDGSGVAVTMEIARVFSTLAKPKWSVLFAAWSGEEEGFWGSRDYVTHPYFPLEGTIAYLNLDMVGYGGGLSGEISEDYSALRAVMTESANQLQISLSVMGFYGGSDHESFQNYDVPNSMFIYLPLDDFYHTPSDTADHLSRKDLLETSKLTALIALKLAEAAVTTSTEEAKWPSGNMFRTPTLTDEVLAAVAVIALACALTYAVKRRKSTA